MSLVSLDRFQVSFYAPFTESQFVLVSLVNGGDERVAFKLKSTRQRRFKTRPTYGFIEPRGGRAVVRLWCHPFDNRHISNRDRFTILAAPAPFGFVSASTLWKLHHPPPELQKTERHELPVIYQDKPNTKTGTKSHRHITSDEISQLMNP